MSWYAFRDGDTIGQVGSEQGIIVADDEHPDGARITLERDGRVAPHAITCGIYGWMLHTRFLASEGEARLAFDAMREALGMIVSAIPLESDPDAKAKSSTVIRLISQFVEIFP
jgi:hypothetical protein